jgi:hypothetical protein
MMVMGQCKLPEERLFYLRMASQEKWSKRELSANSRLRCSSAA